MNVPGASPAFVVAGMHRSGTSLVGGMLAALGVDMGRRLVPADRFNARGYHEDQDIVAFHGRVFRDLLPEGARGHVDWGWCEEHALDASRLVRHADAARELVRERAAAGHAWGFKDPRTTVLLDFWDACLEHARWVLVYRFPWEVSDSMQRGGAEVFRRNPSYGYRVWTHYNERLLAFHERHAERCLLVSANALPGRLDEFQRLLAERLGLDAPDVDLLSSFDAGLFTASSPDDRRADLVAAAYPECTRLLAALDERADVSARGLWRRDAPARTALSGPGRPGDVDVSIVVPVHDDGVLLLDALASVERAAGATTEVVVVDDGSTDVETLRILERLSQRGYVVLRKPNGGLSSARNAGIEAARGRYVLPLDADNRLRHDFVARASALLDADDGVGVVYGDRQLFGAVDEVVRLPAFDLGRMRGGNYVDACALFRRALWEDVGGYDTAMSGLEDWEFWLHAARRGWSFAHLPGVAFDYRVRPGSLLAASLAPATRRRLLRHVLDKHAELFVEGTPAWGRPVSTLLGPLLGPRLHARLGRVEGRAFWKVLWALVGPGGVLAEDRRRRTPRGAE